MLTLPYAISLHFYAIFYALNIVLFPRIINILQPFLRKHWAAFCCSNNFQSIRVIVHTDLLRGQVVLLQSWYKEKKINFIKLVRCTNCLQLTCVL